MTREEVSQLLTLLKVTYPNFYKNLTSRDAMATLEVWYEMFKDDDLNIVKPALMSLFSTNVFPPVPADVKKAIAETKAIMLGEPTDDELFAKLQRAAANSTYDSEKEFNKLPDAVKRFVGSPSGLRTMGKIDEETFNTVTRGQFMKALPIMKQRQEFHDALPESIKNVVGQISGGMRMAELRDGDYDT